MALIVDLVPHMDAGDRNAWPGDQDERPLTDLGRRQAVALADALVGIAIDGLYSGPALRCRQSLDALAERLELPAEVIPELGEKHAWRVPEGWEALTELWGKGVPAEAAFAAGSLDGALQQMRAIHAEGHLIVCSHGHTIPALVAYHAGLRGLPDVPPLEYRGQWYRLGIDGDELTVERIEQPGFPR
jgi:broad specificity phosphatase PhoE